MSVENAGARRTGSERSVLRALVAGRGRQLTVAEIARVSYRSSSGVRQALESLEKAGLVSHQLAERKPGQMGPPRLVYWPTHDGFAFETAAGD